MLLLWLLFQKPTPQNTGKVSDEYLCPCILHSEKMSRGLLFVPCSLLPFMQNTMVDIQSESHGWCLHVRSSWGAVGGMGALWTQAWTLRWDLSVRRWHCTTWGWVSCQCCLVLSWCFVGVIFLPYSQYPTQILVVIFKAIYCCCSNSICLLHNIQSRYCI